jgi:hypothetical protein
LLPSQRSFEIAGPDCFDTDIKAARRTAADTTAVRSGPRRSNLRFYQSPGLACAALLARSVEPALADAIQPGYRTPDGPGHTSAQYFLRGMMTQWLGSDNRAPRLDLNVSWTHVAEPGRTARSDIMEVGIAYSRLVSERTALVIDLVHGAKPADCQVETIMDAGLRTEVIDDWCLSGGAGVGMGQQSPSFRLIFSVQRDFVLFGR